MKFAFIVDNCGVESYYIKDKQSYSYRNNELTVNHNSLSTKSMIGMWSYPFIFDGCFLNWKEWGDHLPDYDLETIIIAIEKDFNTYTVDKLRKKYPNAFIIGMIKEIFLGNVGAVGYSPAFQSEKHKNRIKFLNQCDAIVQPFPELEKSPLTHLIDDCKGNVSYIPFPVDVDYIYENYYKVEKHDSIFMYTTPTHGRRANTLEFTKYISNKFNIPWHHKGDQYVPVLGDLYNIWSQSTFHFNLDPVEWFPGSQAIQVAAAGVINVGGSNNSHKYLFPELATNDLSQLESVIEKIISDQNKRVEIMQFAFNKVNKLYSFDTVRRQVKELKK